MEVTAYTIIEVWGLSEHHSQSMTVPSKVGEDPENSASLSPRQFKGEEETW